MTNHAPTDRAGKVIKARLRHSSAPWHSALGRVEHRIIEGAPKVVIRFKDGVRIELRHSQAVELINAMADVLEGGDDG